MSVLNQEVTESSSGYKKEIDEAGISLLLDTVQIYIYQFPIKSSTRESVSNAIDSITERNIAKILLQDPSRIGEFYVERDGEIYRDSRFDPTYYNPKYMSADDSVYITYQRTGPSELRDRITIKDNGVGLGESRLEGYMKISYSSKRLSTKTLGTFGLGCKSPLATGVDCYSLKTAHNGKEFSFLIYKDKVDPVYSKWNADGSLNDFILFNKGKEREYKVYYKKTTKQNYVEVAWDVKKHQYSEYIDAIKSQLLYFKNPINFQIKEVSGHSSKIDFQANILHETEDYILADQHYFSRPHLIINGVCYGFIEFKELELDQKYGYIGLKMNMEDVTVTPSRESCVWDTKTKDAILKKYENLAKSAEGLINQTLSKLSFIDWIKACSSITTLNSGDSKEMKIISQLAALTGFSSLAIEYKKTGMKFKNNIEQIVNSPFLDFTKVCRQNTYDNKTRRNVETIKYYAHVTDTGNFEGKLPFLQYGGSELIKSAFLCTKKFNSYYNTELLLIRGKARSGDDFKEALTRLMTAKYTLEEALTLVPEFEGVKSTEDGPKRKERIKEYENAFKTIALLMEQKVPIYDDVAVPAGYKTDLVDTTADEVSAAAPTEEIIEQKKIDYAKLRKLSGKIVVQYPRIDYNSEIINSRTEMTPTELADCTDTVVYGTRDELQLLHFLYVISRSDRKNSDSSSKAFTGSPRVCVVSKQVEKHFKPFTPVEEYLFGTDGRTICMELKRIFTSRILSDWFTTSQAYLSKLAEFSPSIAATYEEMKKYINDYNRPYGYTKYFSLLPDDSRTFLEKSVRIQTMLLEKGGDVATAYQADNYKDEDFITVSVYDDVVLEKAKWILDFDKVFGTLFSEITSLAKYEKAISPALAMEIKSIIEARKDRLEQDYPDLCC
jgi:hypothetical protein